MGVVQRVLSAASRMRAVCVVPLVPFWSASGRTVSRVARRVSARVGRSGVSMHAEAETVSMVRDEVTVGGCSLTRLASTGSGATLPVGESPRREGTGKNTVRRDGARSLARGGLALRHGEPE